MLYHAKEGDSRDTWLRMSGLKRFAHNLLSYFCILSWKEEDKEREIETQRERERERDSERRRETERDRERLRQRERER